MHDRSLMNFRNAPSEPKSFMDHPVCLQRNVLIINTGPYCIKKPAYQKRATAAFLGNRSQPLYD
jgi:hypothetical protein